MCFFEGGEGATMMIDVMRSTATTAARETGSQRGETRAQEEANGWG